MIQLTLVIESGSRSESESESESRLSSSRLLAMLSCILPTEAHTHKESAFRDYAKVILLPTFVNLDVMSKSKRNFVFRFSIGPQEVKSMSACG